MHALFTAGILQYLVFYVASETAQIHGLRTVTATSSNAKLRRLVTSSDHRRQPITRVLRQRRLATQSPVSAISVSCENEPWNYQQ